MTATGATTIVAATTEAATMTAAATRSPSVPREADAVFAARSAASNNSSGLKNLGRGVNPARVPVVLYPQGV